MHAEHAARVLQAGCEAGDGQRRGVAGEDAVGGAQGFQALQQLALDLQLLDDRLDHQAGVGQFFQRIGRAQAGEGGGLGGGLQLAFLHQPGELPVDAGDGLGRGAGAGVVQAHRVPGLGGDLGDAGAHGASADHGHRGFSVQGVHGLSVL